MTLPDLPEPAMVHMDAQGYSTPCYTSEQMQEYAIAALRAQPAETFGLSMSMFANKQDYEAEKNKRLRERLDSMPVSEKQVDYEKSSTWLAGHEQGLIDGKAIAVLRAQPAPPPECQTETEKTAYAFGWWKGIESVRMAQPDHSELVKRIRNLGSASGFGARAALLHEAADALEGKV